MTAGDVTADGRTEARGGVAVDGRGAATDGRRGVAADAHGGVVAAPWRSPVTGAPLVADGPHLLRDGDRRWPVVDGIPFLRSGRDTLVERTLAALDAGDVDTARAELLRDRDDWAPGDPPSLGDARTAVAAPTLRAAMDALGYGPVADYFAFRLSDPTYLSGLALLGAYPGTPVAELGCGIGLLLRAVDRDGTGTVGLDVVWSKLWLARRFVVPEAQLACCDARDALPLPDGAAAVALCHDALYFLPAKAHVAAELRRIAPTVLVGHAHNALVENHSAGEPLTPEAYADLLPGSVLFDDAELTLAALEDRPPRPAAPEDLHAAAAIALAPRGPGAAGRLTAADPRAHLVRNPLLREDGTIAWPSRRYEAEYAALSGYLTTPAGDDADRVRLRQLVDVPPEWGVSSPSRDTPVAGWSRLAAHTATKLDHPPAVGGSVEVGRGGERRPLGLGLIGCGWVARDHLLPAAAATDAVRVAGAHDPAGVPDGIPAHASIEALLADPGVDAVYVATPNDRHPEVVEAAAAAGKAILCEKPMAATLAGAERIAAAVRAHGVPYATAFDQRHHPAHVALRDLIVAGRLGTVTAIRIVYCCWVGPDWAADNWRADPERAGGGALYDLAPHGLDLVGALTGESLTDVVTLKQRRVQPYAVDDGAVLAARTARGVLATLHVAYNHPEDRPRRRLEVVGTDGIATAVDTMGQDPGGTLTIDGEPVPFDATVSPFTRQLEAFAAAVSAGRPPEPGLDHDLRLHALLEPCR